MKKKIGVLTYHSSDNFGSVLQAYALCKTLNELGYDCEIIDYRKREVVELYSILKPINSKYDIVSNVYNLKNFLKLSKRKNKFEKFRQEHMSLSNNRYNTIEELKCIKNYYDIFIVGSDQVWNTEIVDFDLSYVLSFTNKIKISYAASLGPKVNNIEKIKFIKSELNKFNHITVREESAKKIIESLLDKKVDVVLDPVLLLSNNDWEKIIPSSKVNDEEYLLCYFAGGVSKEMENKSKEIAKQINCKRVLLMPEWRNFYKFDDKRYESGPLEFLQLIKNAKAIFTNSFHGTAFSIIFNKPFYVGMHSPKSDERINTLLKKCNLRSREIIGDSCPKQEVDFEFANEYIRSEREKCIKLINSMLGE